MAPMNQQKQNSKTVNKTSGQGPRAAHFEFVVFEGLAAMGLLPLSFLDFCILWFLSIFRGLAAMGLWPLISWLFEFLGPCSFSAPVTDFMISGFVLGLAAMGSGHWFLLHLSNLWGLAAMGYGHWSFYCFIIFEFVGSCSSGALATAFC